MDTPAPAASTRPQRADAVRNRARVLEAGRAAFAEHGADAQMEDVARRAGVGVGTVYRHFPNRQTLIAAIAVDHFTRIAADARASLEDGDATPWDAFARFILRSGERMARDAGIAEIAANHPEAMETAATSESGLRDAATALIARAVADGSMRADASVQDVPLMMCGLGNLMASKCRAAGMSWERYLQLMLDGLRAR